MAVFELCQHCIRWVIFRMLDRTDRRGSYKCDSDKPILLHFITHWKAQWCKSFNRGPKRLYDSKSELHSKQEIATESGQKIPEEVGSYYVGVFYHSAVRCWNRGAVLSWSFIFEFTQILTRLRHKKNSTTFMWRIMAVTFIAGKTTWY
jgi:hypothetical protein